MVELKKTTVIIGILLSILGGGSLATALVLEGGTSDFIVFLVVGLVSIVLALLVTKVFKSDRNRNYVDRD